MSVETFERHVPRTRVSTLIAYQSAVETVVARMRNRPHEPLNLAEMAAFAGVSRCHFDRVFRNVTGLCPRHFQTALRLRAATRLLLTTSFSVTEICFAVGYESLGSFVTRFTQAFGLSPQRVRQLGPSLHVPLSRILPADDAPRVAGAESVRGMVSGCEGIAFIGLFRRRIADEAPAHCAIVRGSGPFALDAADGRWWVLAIAMHPSRPAIDLILDDDIPRAAWRHPLHVTAGRADRDIALEMRPALPVDPPVNLVLPLLLRIHQTFF